MKLKDSSCKFIGEIFFRSVPWPLARKIKWSQHAQGYKLWSYIQSSRLVPVLNGKWLMYELNIFKDCELCLQHTYLIFERFNYYLIC